MIVLFPRPATAGNTYNIVYAFTGGTDGDQPMSIVADNAGNIYGVTYTGGSSANCIGNCGTIFKIAPDGTKSTLYSFVGAPTDAARPVALAMDRHGNLYGVGGDGGAYNYGSVFKLTANGSEALLYSFDPNKIANGIYPSGLAVGKDGNLYGMTQYGGDVACSNGCGTVFRMVPKTGKLTVLHAFLGPSGNDGWQPTGGLTVGPDGMLYGTTIAGGSGANGTVFKMDPVSGAETVLHAFTRTKNDGGYPEAPPVFDSNGNLYGGTMQSAGTDCLGLGCGMLYKIAPDGTYTILYDFGGGGGHVGPYFGVSGTLYLDRRGDVFGITIQGGDYLTCNPPAGCGSVFELTAAGRIKTVYTFQGTASADGYFPQWGLIHNPSLGKDALYGVTAFGPDCDMGCGSVFKVTTK
ncbi:MAG: hypothetical protein JOZ13_15230 [Alphaproteobacteria bacterium]|nr:hypothetical protein [Alphaproteobacteria bacterium]